MLGTFRVKGQRELRRAQTVPRYTIDLFRFIFVFLLLYHGTFNKFDL